MIKITAKRIERKLKSDGFRIEVQYVAQKKERVLVSFNVNKDQWDTDNRIIINHENAAQYNELIASTKFAVSQIEIEFLQREKRMPTAIEMQDWIRNKRRNTKEMDDYFPEYLRSERKSLQPKQSLQSFLKRFQKDEGDSIYIDEIDRHLIKRLVKYAFVKGTRHGHPMANHTVNLMIIQFNKMVKWLLSEEYITENKCANFNFNDWFNSNYKYSSTNAIDLEDSDVEDLINFDMILLKGKTYKHTLWKFKLIKDSALFMLNTSLRISDATNLKVTEVLFRDGLVFIDKKLNAQKNDRYVVAPALRS